MTALVTDLRTRVKDVQRLSGHAQEALSPKAPGGGTKVINLADVMTYLLTISDVVAEARLAIEDAAKAAGARERTARRG
jgi:hypothetical protein